MIRRRSFLALTGTAILGTAGYAGLSVVFARAQEATTMAPQEAHAAARRGDILLVDIRRPDEWAKTGIGEYAVPLDLREDDFISNVMAARRDTTQPCALICARGVRSARTTVRLANAGFTAIIDVPEGMLGSFAGPGWLARELPTVAYSL